MDAIHINVKEMPAIKVAYVSHKGKMEDIKTAYAALLKWATPLGLLNNHDLKMITLYHDSPKITDPKNIRMSACVVLEKPIEAHGKVSLRTINAGKCIITRFEIKPFEFQIAWENSFAWMKENGFKKDQRDPFEIYHNNAENHPEQKFIVDFCIPVL